MNHQKSELYFLFCLLILTLILSFFLFKPFIYILILAVVFATVFAPVHRKILKWTNYKSVLSALLSTVIVLVVVIIPISFLATQVFQESSRLYLSITQGDSSLVVKKTEAIFNNVRNFAHLPTDFAIDLKLYVSEGLKWFVPRIGSVLSNFASATISIFIFLMALYYIFKDGSKLKKAVVSASPLQDVHDEAIFNKLTKAINAVIRGNLGIVIIQGILVAIGFLIFNVPNPALWGSIAAITAFIPGVGTAIVILPAALYLFWTGQTAFAIGLIIWGVTAVGLIDNFLGPRLVERGMHIHPFLILLSIFGGLSLFGPLGFILGPLVLSFLFALLDIYFEIHRKQIIR